jgi:hypothetical protein
MIEFPEKSPWTGLLYRLLDDGNLEIPMSLGRLAITSKLLVPLSSELLPGTETVLAIYPLATLLETMNGLKEPVDGSPPNLLDLS